MELNSKIYLEDHYYELAPSHFIAICFNYLITKLQNNFNASTIFHNCVLHKDNR